MWSFPTLLLVLRRCRTIADARVSFESTEGFEFANVFFPRQLLPQLPMKLPYTAEVAKKVKEMKERSGRIGINFEIDIPVDS